MKFLSSITLGLIVIVILLTSTTVGFAVRPKNTVLGASNQALEVWFDPLQFTNSCICLCLLEVHAQTSSGLFLSSLHWDFGDGSTLDIPLSGQSMISDVRGHIYAVPGTYSVIVVAYDNAGNNGTATLTLSDVTPGSCVPDPDWTPTLPAIAANSTVRNQQTSLRLPPGGQMYLYAFVTGGDASSSTFRNGTYAYVTDDDGNLTASIAATASDSNSYKTLAAQYVIGGIAVTGYSSYSASYGSSPSPGASDISDTFAVSTPNSLVVVLGLAGGDQCLSIFGLPGFKTDTTNNETMGSPNFIEMGHAYLAAGVYTAIEHTQQCPNGQDPNYAGDLIGVFVFQPTTTSSTSPPPNPIPYNT